MPGDILNGAGAQVFGCLNFADLVQSYDMYTLKLENSLVLMIFNVSLACFYHLKIYLYHYLLHFLLQNF